MKIVKLFALIIVLLPGETSSAPRLATSVTAIVYEKVLAGKECEETPGQRLQCTYKVGESLHINIYGIGMKGTSVTFLKSDRSADYFAGYGTDHGCIVVSANAANLNNMLKPAYISPYTGIVYKNWPECKNDH